MTRTEQVKERTAERGASLVLIMVLLLVVSVIVAVLARMAFTGTRSTRDHKVERALRYAADGALEMAVQVVAANPEMGEVPGDPCQIHNNVGVKIENRGPGAVMYNAGDAMFQGGSAVKVTCDAYRGDTSAPDGDGGQRTRYVEFTATCVNYVPQVGSQKPACYASDHGVGSQNVVVATARVQYDINYDPNVPSDERAIIPKVMSWELLPGWR